MKKILILAFALAACALTTMAQYVSVDFPATEYSQDPKANYRLYKTKNNYNFIKLDTRTGQMELVQWSTDDNTMSYMLSNNKLVYSSEEEIPGRFTLYATTNIYNFVLLDQIDGRTWQVQWNKDKKYRFVERIYFNPEPEVVSGAKVSNEKVKAKAIYKDDVLSAMIGVQRAYAKRDLRKSAILKAYVDVFGEMSTSKYQEEWEYLDRLNQFMLSLLEDDSLTKLMEIESKLAGHTDHDDIKGVFNSYLYE